MGFPNVHTVKLNVLRSMVDTASRKAFENREFPQITSVMLSPQAYPLIRSCPNLKSLWLIGCDAFSEWGKYIKPSQAIQNLVVDFGHYEIEGECKTTFIQALRLNEIDQS